MLAVTNQVSGRLRLRHTDALRLHHLPPADANRLAAREYRRPGRQSLLMIDNEVPFGSLGPGYPRAKEMLTVAAATGWSVTLYPLRRAEFEWEEARLEIDSNIGIIARLGTAGLAKFLEERKGFTMRCW